MQTWMCAWVSPKYTQFSAAADASTHKLNTCALLLQLDLCITEYSVSPTYTVNVHKFQSFPLRLNYTSAGVISARFVHGARDTIFMMCSVQAERMLNVHKFKICVLQWIVCVGLCTFSMRSAWIVRITKFASCAPWTNRALTASVELYFSLKGKLWDLFIYLFITWALFSQLFGSIFFLETKIIEISPILS